MESGLKRPGPCREPEPTVLTLISAHTHTQTPRGWFRAHQSYFEFCRADRPARGPSGHLCYRLQEKPLCS